VIWHVIDLNKAMLPKLQQFQLMPIL